MNTPSVALHATSVLLDGTIRCLTAFDNGFACCVGSQIVAFDVLPEFRRKVSIPLPSQIEISRLAIDGENLFALERAGVLWFLRHGADCGWQRFHIDDIYDIGIAGRYLYCLKAGELITFDLESQLLDGSLTLPTSSRRLRILPPFIVAFALSLLWIALLDSGGLQPIYHNESDFPYPIAATAFRHEIIIADHLAGLVNFCLHGTTLIPNRSNASFLHPYAVALDENGWIAAGESGLKRSDSEMPDIRPGTVMDLQPTRHGILAIQTHRITLLRGSRSLGYIDFPGFAYRAQAWGSLLACSTQNGLYLFTIKDASVITLEYVLKLPEISFDIVPMGRYLLAVTPRSLYAIDVGNVQGARIVSQLAGVGEPVSVTVDTKRRLVFWGCGRSIRTVDIDEAGRIAITGEVMLGVYPRALAVGGSRLYVAAGPGGLLCSKSNRNLCLEPVKGVDYAVDVSANDYRTAIASVRALYSLPNGDPEHAACILEGHDISSCVLGNRLLYAEGKTLQSIDFSKRVSNGHRLRHMPYVPRRLALLDFGAIVVGEGGVMIVHLKQRVIDATS